MKTHEAINGNMRPEGGISLRNKISCCWRSAWRRHQRGGPVCRTGIEHGQIELPVGTGAETANYHHHRSGWPDQDQNRWHRGRWNADAGDYRIPTNGGMGTMQKSKAYDGVSAKMLGPGQREIDRLKDGKVVYTVVGTVSADGKSIKTV